ncbi:serine/threonine protein kinase, putative [Entamoeba dispar SAW760]|uniref:non-specific serine/threonine protein kinase n=1 Tax=Entamoeba dispar (strain ATCC PRA-260 / SAW760) TaxID=370354 RepID=B0ERN7_ENTDS|nr:serine/threonine protein kinase, putative [Entamoeba dispar SAW760]EDR22800.1 serine/threonine protein kinase, putative [Entamoeba dispar SAW760]|eukprot:EDR22800.1 serine/threonine protein kinase, putative [Entamoeba dispar SAW760]
MNVIKRMKKEKKLNLKSKICITMSLLNETTTPTKLNKKKKSIFNSDCITFTPIGSGSSTPRRESIIGSLLSDELKEISIESVISELYFDQLTLTTSIVHIININLPKTHIVLHKFMHELNELDKYVTAVYGITAPYLPKKSFYPLHNEEITQYLQEVICLDKFFDSIYVKEFFRENPQISQCMSLHHPQMSGLLMKEGYLLKRWKERFVVVKNSYLFYFVSEKSMVRLEQPRCIVSLSGAILSTNGLVIKITTKERQVFNFSCTNETTLNQWLVALNAVICFKPSPQKQQRMTKKYTLLGVDELNTPIQLTKEIKTVTPRRSTEFLISRVNCLKDEADKIIESYEHQPDKESLVMVLKQFKQIQSVDLSSTSLIDYYNSKIVQFGDDPLLFRFLQIFKEIRELSGIRPNVPKLCTSPLGRYSLQSKSSSSSTQTSPRTLTSQITTQCRLCNNTYYVDELTKHSYYCKLCNEICLKQTTCKTRLLAIAEEINKQKRYHKGSVEYSGLAEKALKCSQIEVINQNNIDYMNDAEQLLQQSITQKSDVCYKTFALIVIKLIKLRRQMFINILKGDYGENGNMWEFLSVVSNELVIEDPQSKWQQVKLDDFEVIKKFSEGAYSKLYLVKKKTTGDVYAMKVSKKSDMKRKNVIDGVLAEKKILQLSNTRRCIHRDLKPDNVLIDKNGHLLLTDFGLSVVGLCNEQHGIKESRLLCTPDYVAPESLRDYYYCQASDYFSLGCMVYEMLIGIPPFHSESPNQIFELIKEGIYDWPEDINISEECKDFVNGLLTVDYNQRLGAKSIDEIKNHKWMKPISFDSLLSESREDIFVPELENELDTGYFDIDVDRNNTLVKDEDWTGDNTFYSFDCVNTNQVIDQNIEIVERRSSAVNLCDDEDEGSQETTSEQDDNNNDMTRSMSMFNFHHK